MGKVLGKAGNSTIQNLQFTRDKTSKRPSVKWEIPKDVTTVRHFLLIITDEVQGENEVEVARFKVLPPGGGRVILERSLSDHLTENTHRADVKAIDKWGSVLETKSIRFVVERVVKPSGNAGWAACQQKLLPQLSEFIGQNGRGPTFLVIGKQHHGKSSLVNHLNRCFCGSVDIPDTARAAPPGDSETTTKTQKVVLPLLSFPGSKVIFVDVPAFATMNYERTVDLGNLLYNASDNAGRGEFYSILPSPPDGVIVVVSLLALRDQGAEMKQYLRILQGALGTFPFVVAATHRDAFLVEEGNKGNDPRAGLLEAIRDLREMANTNAVFAIANYDSQSWWAPAVDHETSELLRQLTTNAQRRQRAHAMEDFCWWCIRGGLGAGVIGVAIIVAARLS